MFLVYRALRIFYVSFWFYWGPFAALSLQFIIPFS
jgi:hypothetical protein